ncbi:unnamed protein product, partial [Polarella glacialis]
AVLSAKDGVLNATELNLLEVHRPRRRPDRNLVTTNQALFRNPKDFCRDRLSPQLARTFEDPTTDYGRAGRSSWHYTPHKPPERGRQQH